MRTWCIGVDLGGTYIKLAAVDRDYEPAAAMSIPTPTSGAADVIEAIARGVETVMQRLGVERSAIIGLGIGSPGPIDIAKGLIRGMPNLPGMANCHIRDLLAKRLGVAAALENDANAAALGEYLGGPAEHSGDMVLLTLGTGVGSGIIVHGKVLHGMHDMAAELGHLIVKAGGLKCGCGQRGCLEQYCSATNLAAYAKRRLARSARPSPLREVLKARGEITARDISEACAAGDELASEVWDQATYYLAVGCVNICRIFDPECIVFGGGMAAAGEDLLGPVRRHFQQLHWSLTPPMTSIVLSSLGNDAGAIGAAGVAWQQFGD